MVDEKAFIREESKVSVTMKAFQYDPSKAIFFSLMQRNSRQVFRDFSH